MRNAAPAARLVPPLGTASATDATVIVGFGAKRLVKLSIGGATMTATAGHPFWVSSRAAWIDAEDLEAGDVLREAEGDLVTVDALRVCAAGDQTVYNLTVAVTHTYHAGGRMVLVHNQGDPCEETAKGGVYTCATKRTRWRGQGARRICGIAKGDHRRGKKTKDLQFKTEYRTDKYDEQRSLEEVLHKRYPNARLNRNKAIGDRNKERRSLPRGGRALPQEPVLRRVIPPTTAAGSFRRYTFGS